MNLDKSFLFKRFRKELEDTYGADVSSAMWHDAKDELLLLEESNPDADKNDKSFVFPAVALYRAIERHAPGDALAVTRAYGTQAGVRLKYLFRRLTAFPGAPNLIWKKMPAIAAKMSSRYETEDLVATEHLCSLHVTGCPMYDGAKRLGTPEAAQMICCMDKEYMSGFRGVRYTRTKSLAEGDDYCDYLLEDSRG